MGLKDTGYAFRNKDKKIIIPIHSPMYTLLTYTRYKQNNVNMLFYFERKTNLLGQLKVYFIVILTKPS